MNIEQLKELQQAHLSLLIATRKIKSDLLAQLAEQIRVVDELERNPLSFVFDEDTLNNRDTIEEGLKDRAIEDCAGMHKCGRECYTQQCWLNGTLWECIGTYDYNRHDKIYHYIEDELYEWKKV